VAEILLESAGGLALLVGDQTRGTALALLVLLMPTTLIFHAVPRLNRAPRPQQRRPLRKHLASEAGRLQLMADDAGAFVLDRVGNSDRDGAHGHPEGTPHVVLAGR
jgi:uncharacterized membrane protein YphA (DoxX/SURF4 family)